MGLVAEFPYDPQVQPGTKVFQKPTPLPPDRRKWVMEALEKLEKAGVIKRVASCECAAGLVLVE